MTLKTLGRIGKLIGGIGKQMRNGRESEIYILRK